MSDSEVFLRDEVIRVSEEWGFSKADVKTVETWDPTLTRGSVSLFGQTSIIHLDLTDNNKLKAFVKLLTDKNTKDMFKENWIGSGVIITSTHARGAKKVETLVESSGGIVQKKAKPEEMKRILMERISLNKEAREFLLAYVGDDYQILIGIANQISKMTDEEQKKLTIEDLIVRLPGKPGTLPPWDFINPMLEGNTNEAIKLYERAVEGSHVLVTMKLARTKLQLLYRLKLLQNAGIRDSKKQAECVGERNGPNIWITSKVAQKVSIQTAEYLAKLALITESNLKGGSQVDSNLIFKNFIASTCLAINYNRALHLSSR